jgi:hypothetical protein
VDPRHSFAGRKTSGSPTAQSALRRATSPSQAGLGFGVRAKVARSTDVGRKVCA